jgi:hypothetical protein
MRVILQDCLISGYTLGPGYGADGDAFDFKLTTEPTAAADFDNDGDVDGRDFLVWQRADGGDSSIDDLAVDPTNPNTGHTPEWSNLRSGDPGLPAVQMDDTFDFTTEPTEPEAAATAPTQRLIAINFGNGGLAHSNTDDGGIIIEWTPGPDDDGFLIVNWLAEDHVDPNNPNADLRDGEYVLTGLQHVATDTSSATGDSYAGSHALYDLFLPM